MQIIDNFIPPKIFEEVQSRMLGYGFPWMWNDFVTKEDKSEDEFQFIHSFYAPLSGVVTPYTEYRKILAPYVDNMNVTSLMRIKANLNVRTAEPVARKLHRDFEVDCKTAIAYINTNNGYTLFEDGTKVECVANRIVIFDSKMLHAGVTCTDEKRRVVINFNYL